MKEEGKATKRNIKERISLMGKCGSILLAGEGAGEFICKLAFLIV